MAPSFSETALSATVLAVQANFYWVRLEDCPSAPDRVGSHLLCTRRARLKKIGQQVIVGDRVQVEEPDWASERGVIVAVAARQTQLDRPPIANADQILLLFALAQPEPEPYQLSRFLVKAESTGLHVCVCLSKQDLVSTEQQQAWRDRLQTWGYSPYLVSTSPEPTGLTPLISALRDHITVVAGPSGVGKSSLINALIPAATLRTGAVSGKLGRGRHTTRHVALFELPDSGFLADTPGFNHPEIHCHPAQLGDYFPEIRQRLQQQDCQFRNCLHQDEPGCAVRDDWERYDHYLLLLAECRMQQQAQDESPDPESTLKAKVADQGRVQHEPRLATKKYRRVSRRSRKQALQDLRYELADTVDHLESMDADDWDTAP